jgi:hydroxyacylglutathione hydrolase
MIPVLSDNYVYLLHEPRQGVTAAVDPGEAGPVLEALRRRGRHLDLVLVTHHHGDHVGGLAEVKAATGCAVVGPRADAGRVAGLDRLVGEGDRFGLGAFEAHTLATPGHTRGHVSYWLPDAEALFCGDTLFALGCGRLLEGDAPTMWGSLQKLRDLPEATRAYCGHEYTASNARFARSVDPGNAELARRAEEVEALRSRGEPTLPTTIGLERRTNPFLRPEDQGIRAGLGLGPDAEDREVFAELRRRKDRA